MKKPTFKEAFLFWFKLWWIGFGWPIGQIAIMREYVVEKKKWISDSKFLHALNFCNLLPWPEAQQLATYIGWLLHGTKWGIAAWVLFVIPSIFILISLSILYVKFWEVPVISSIFDFLKAVVVAIILMWVVKIAKKALTTWIHYIIAFLSFIWVLFFHISYPIVLIGVIILAIILYKFKIISSSNSKESHLQNKEEEKYYINANTKIKSAWLSIKRLLLQFLLFILLFTIPLIPLYLFSEDINFWRDIVDLFTKWAFVTFWWAYTVVQYISQVSVENYHWLSASQMVDWFALWETTPWPLVMILAFVWFMAGFTHFNWNIILAISALLITVYYTFLPSLFFIFAWAPIVEKTWENKSIKVILSIITASIVWVILTLAVFFWKTIMFSWEINFWNINFILVVWVIISLIVMMKYKIDMMWMLGASVVIWILKFLIF